MGWMPLREKSAWQKVGEEQCSLNNLDHLKKCGGIPLTRRREQAVNSQSSMKVGSNILSGHQWNKFVNRGMHCMMCTGSAVDYLAAAVGGGRVGEGGLVRGGGMVGEGVVVVDTVFALFVVLVPQSALLAFLDDFAGIPHIAISLVPTLPQMFPIKSGKENFKHLTLNTFCSPQIQV